MAMERKRAESRKPAGKIGTSIVGAQVEDTCRTDLRNSWLLSVGSSPFRFSSEHSGFRPEFHSFEFHIGASDARACPGFVQSTSTSLSSREVVLESLLRDPEVETSERECGDGATREEFRTSCSEETYDQLKERGSASGAELEIAECGLESPIPLNYVEFEKTSVDIMRNGSCRYVKKLDAFLE
ncbi:hypothetical protein R1flu_011251 [Riccia fluitans]|uniref:Uncharacterized protein n=1 Tax=Riccia fluitans TaxID=41844 RepID=A0ABD1Z7A4_9MARC